MLWLFGSSSVSVIPRSDDSAPPPRHVPGPQLGSPSKMKVKCPPPSVDLNKPNGGRGVGGFDVVAPVPATELTPRIPRADETYIIFAFVGSITMELIERPRNAFPV